MQRRIQRRPPDPEPDELPAGLHPVLRRVYRNRGLRHGAELELGLDRLLSYHRLKGIDAAAALLAEALAQRWHVCIVGDYDADGATGTALLVAALREFGAARVSYIVPDRFRLGYGLSPGVVELARPLAPQLLVTVDNGIASIEGVAAARAAGMRVLITDHHLPGAQLPAADAIVNPNQPGCGFPSKALSGVGTAFYLLTALRARLRESGAVLPNLARYLDLVALGTVADVVPLDHNNRILVSQGLRCIRQGRGRPGILALLQAAGRDPAQAVAADLGFAAGPRLNAAGRLQDMGLGIECLLSADAGTAHGHALQLDRLNRERREIQQQMQDEALAAVAGLQHSAARELPPLLCVEDEHWHQGVVGLVAGKLKDRYHRPVIALAPDEQPGMLKGSARSIPGLHIRDLLDAVASRRPGLITRFGGHAMAAGLTLPRAHLPDFIAAVEAEAARLLPAVALQGVIESDGELAADELGLPLAELLQAAGPWGQAFPEPIFDGVFAVLDTRVVGERHLRLRLRSEAGGTPVEAIGFHLAGSEIGPRMRIAYRLDVNEYQGRRSGQLRIEHLEPA